jgi:FkbM family methyltransferase
MRFSEPAKAFIDSLPLRVRHGIKRGYYARQVRRGEFESEEPDLDLALEVLQPGDWAIDVGANIGHYTIPMARRVAPRGRVIAIEPVLETFELLGCNVNAAGVTNVTLLNLASSSAARRVRIAVPRDASGFRWLTRARISDGEDPRDTGRDAGEEVLALPVDRLCPEGPIRLVKIDAEGHEAQVIEGMRALLRRDRPLLVVEDQPGHRVPLLDELDFRAFQLTGSPNRIYAPSRDLPYLRAAGAREMDPSQPAG